MQRGSKNVTLNSFRSMRPQDNRNPASLKLRCWVPSFSPYCQDGGLSSLSTTQSSLSQYNPRASRWTRSSHRVPVSLTVNVLLRRSIIHRPPLHPHHLSRLKTVLWFFFNGTQKLFFIKIYPGSHVLFIKLITETRWKKLMRSKCISNSLRFPRMGKCFLLYSLKVHHHLIKILRKGMRVAKLALKVDNLK